jgi:hypothetical protein
MNTRSTIKTGLVLGRNLLTFNKVLRKDLEKMNLHKNWKVIILMIVMTVREVVISQLTCGGGDNVIWQIAGEVPEPGSILLLALGGLWLRNENRKNRRRLKY